MSERQVWAHRSRGSDCWAVFFQEDRDYPVSLRKTYTKPDSDELLPGKSGMCFRDVGELVTVYELLADALREAVRAGQLSPLVIVELGLTDDD